MSYEQKPLIQTKVDGFEFNPNKSLTYSSLKNFKKSPLNWVNYIRSPFVETDAMLLGKLLDVMVFTPDTVQEKYFKVDDTDIISQIGGAKPRGTTKYADWKKTLPNDKKLIPLDTWTQAEQMAKAIMGNQDARAKLDLVTNVHSKFYWDDEETGLLCSVELDGDGENIIVELKSDKDATPDSFQRSAFSYDYPLQAAFCLEGIKAKKFQFPEFYYIVVEPNPPFNVAVYKADEDYISYGLWDMKKTLKDFRFCAEQNLFHQSYEFRQTLGYNTLSIPSWAKYRMENI